MRVGVRVLVLCVGPRLLLGCCRMMRRRSGVLIHGSPNRGMSAVGEAVVGLGRGSRRFGGSLNVRRAAVPWGPIAAAYLRACGLAGALQEDALHNLCRRHLIW